ncbi:radical SAM/SPASM domain-containing protein [Nonomuraea fuscirosea]|uniref:radical SAM/SPASM domain-containing protein n=1 Tax=Nonomuraea fuscirosea TaxID=1291556 RepID=UPI0034423DD2
MTAEPAFATPASGARPALASVWFLELELTQRCQLRCPSLCYADAGPTKGHGQMTCADWERLLDTAPAAGITTVQLIGGEPTVHPDFSRLAEHALGVGLRVQVYSNLYRVTGPLWELYSHPDVTLATSYYSDVAAEHDRITDRRGSHARTRANILRAIERGIALKVGIVDLGGPGQRADEAREEMIGMGAAHVGAPDRIRAVGRAARTMGVRSNVNELCGQCGDGRAAVSWNGDVRMCVLSRFLPSAGNVRTTRLADIFGSAAWYELLAQVPRRPRPRDGDCKPNTLCKPNQDGGDCKPAETICEGDALVLPRISAREIRPETGGGR